MKLTDTEAALFNAKRFTITTVLYIRRPQTMAQLRKATGLSWGDLDSNIRYLEKKRLVKSRKVVTKEGPRTLVELTENGEKAYVSLVSKLTQTIREITG